MKLDKKILKKLILETLQEADPRDEDTGTAYDDVRAGMESEPQPKDLEPEPENMSLTDIAGYFRNLKKESEERLEKIKSMKSTISRAPVPTLEEIAAIREEAKRVQEEYKEIYKSLEDLKQNLKK
jgi:hypothetical protein